VTFNNAGCVRADLHVHSWFSGQAGHLRFLKARDCYSDPEHVYKTARKRGMGVVTITDHDSIDGCLEVLERYPDADDFFISEEIECAFPDVELKVHVGAYDITERIHRDIQPLRSNVFEATAYLRSEGVFYSLNHPFFFFKNQIAFSEYVECALRCFPAFEVRNGTMLASHNRLAEEIARQAIDSTGHPIVPIAGSDSHSLFGIGSTFTETPGKTREDFLTNLRAGVARPGGRHGGIWRGAKEIYAVVGNYWASLLGFGRQDLSWQRRVIGLAFSGVSMPFQFSPLVVAALHKRGEAARVEQYRRERIAAHTIGSRDCPPETLAVGVNADVAETKS
jgi:predicted metal-dependent phosphoesterase TrpH